MKALSSLLKSIDISWIEPVEKALMALESDYLQFILKNQNYFPDIDNFLNPFKTLSLNKTRYILFGQDPYPRYESAIGYAFIDAKVKEIFSKNGLSKEVNRATSLRNFIKMLLLCDNLLDKNDLSQKAISKIKKEDLCQDIISLKDNFEKNGVLLLNMALIFTKKQESKYHLKKWKPFIKTLLNELNEKDIKLILFGNAAKEIENLNISKNFKKLKFVHPYNISFIQDKEAHKLFKPMSLMKKIYQS